jgi:8-oxo-dGTP pyrophosphatase MutT (NUDIX family)
VRDIDSLREALLRIDPVNEREKESIVATLARLERPGSPYSDDDPEHLTASAFVISALGVILHRHRRLNIWVQPGGHVDSGEEPAGAAVRETREETGLEVRHVDPMTLFHVDVHPGPREHRHFDLRYVLLAEPDDPCPPRGESPDVFWFDFVAARERAESALVPALAKLERWARERGVTN